ncbi:MAG: sugar transferase [Proteobacteria bacterium]|nr:sugar transferase [Pseudomonadota bacterium]MBU1688198.1 sugar transferase [Pseudomonadota bacterium]
MPPRYREIILTLSRLFDLSLVGAAFIGAYFLKRWLPLPALGGLATEPNYYLVLTLALISCNFGFKLAGMYQPLANSWLKKRFIKVFRGIGISIIFLIVFLFSLHITGISRGLLAIFALLTTAILLLKVLLVYRYKMRTGAVRKTENVLVIGSRARAVDTITALVNIPGHPYHILGCLEIDDTPVGQEVTAGVKIIGRLENFRKIILNTVIDEVIFALPLKMIINAGEYIAAAEEVGVHVRIMPDWQIQNLMYQPAIANISFDDTMGIPTLSLSATPQKTTQRFIKEIVDFTGSLTALIFLTPLLLLIALAIKATTPGPVFFTQERSGLNGRKFKMYKFRTMVADAEALREQLLKDNEQKGPVFKIRKDPRITGLGAFLRRTSLDELPQLFNVLKGEMSLVGPRPPIPAEVTQYEPWQRRRLSMKPGLTCIWQVSGRNGVTFRRWMTMDLEYIDNWSLLMDFKLLLLTVRAVVFASGH